MTRGARAIAGAVVVVVLAACSGAERNEATAPSSTTSTTLTAAEPPPTTTTTAAPKAKPTALSSFASCAALLRHVKREASKVVTPYGLPSFGAFGGVAQLRASAGVAASGDAGTSAPASGGAESAMADSSGGPGFSGTNVQEAGVDEPDLVKTDGQLLVSLQDAAVRVVDISGSAPRSLATIALPPTERATGLLMSGRRLVVLGSGHPYGFEDSAGSAPGGRPDMSMPEPFEPRSTIRVFDLTDPARPKDVGTLSVDGQYVSSRLVGGVVRAVVSSSPAGPGFAVPQSPGEEARALASNRAAIASSKLDDWLPTYTLERPGQKPVTKPLSDCSSVLKPKDFTGLSTVSVLTVDPGDPKPEGTACVLGAGSIVYASPANLYVATQKWNVQPMPAVRPDGGSDVGVMPRRWTDSTTELHQFSIAGREPAVYTASGVLDGRLLNQFSMSEHEGRLRVATTVQGERDTDNLVSVLEAKDGKLRVVGRIAGLGHEGETIHGVRFLGNKGYVVTFRQTDPLYVLDLSNPAKPVLKGELEMPGFSSYLHPISDTVLLGVGTGPGERGGSGLQLSLFDVSDPARPTRTANVVFEHGWSEAQNNHHALLWWPASKLLVVPFADGMGHFGGALAVRIDGPGFGPQTRLSHAQHAPTPDRWMTIQRSVVAGSRLLTISPVGLMTSDLAALTEQAWLPWAAR